jgi:anion-transporting  ArsA/GET3 family ATPase
VAEGQQQVTEEGRRFVITPESCVEGHRPKAYDDVPEEGQDEDSVMVVFDDILKPLEPKPHKNEVGCCVHAFGAVVGQIVVLGQAV